MDLSLSSLHSLKQKTPAELMAYGEKLGIENAASMRPQDLIFAILQHYAQEGTPLSVTGVIEVMQDGFGFLRSPEVSYAPGPDDIYVTPQLVKRWMLRTGDTVEGVATAPQDGERYFSLSSLTKINFLAPESTRHRVHFDNLTPLYPSKRIHMEIDGSEDKDITLRVMSIVTPMGFGQRALLVAPPRTGKTIMLQQIAAALAQNHPQAYLIVLLIGERPEEVTDMRRSVRGEVVSSTFDEPPTRHVQVAEMVIEKSKRLVEAGHDVVILLDSITRLSRAYNTVLPSSGKVLTGGVDANALQKPKHIFGAARNLEEGGSLTIIGTALVETGSRMDDVIFEEFKGTGNAEVILDRKIAERRVFPAIDIARSGTRKEELLFENRSILHKIWVLRRILHPMGPAEAMEFLADKMRSTKNNASFFDSMNTDSRQA